MTNEPRSIEPHWPSGEVAIIKPTDDKGTYTAERLPIVRALKSKEGYLLIVGELARSTEVLLVDEDGYSAECRPWTETLEHEITGAEQDKHGRYLVEEITPTYLPRWGEHGSW